MFLFIALLVLLRPELFNSALLLLPLLTTNSFAFTDCPLFWDFFFLFHSRNVSIFWRGRHE